MGAVVDVDDAGLPLVFGTAGLAASAVRLLGLRLIVGLAKRVAIRASSTFWPMPMLTML